MLLESKKEKNIMSTNFFAGWTVEYIPQSPTIGKQHNTSRIRTRDTARSRRTKDVDLIMQSKVKLIRKTDNLTLSEGDTVYFEAPDVVKELWYVYRIDVNEIMGKITVHGILLQDNKTLKEDYDAEIPLTNSLTKETSDAYEIVIIPEIKDFISNASYTHINIHSFAYYENNKNEFQNTNEEHKFLNKIFVSTSREFIPFDFDALVSQEYPGCATTLDKILYLIDENSGKSKKHKDEQTDAPPKPRKRGGRPKGVKTSPQRKKRNQSKKVLDSEDEEMDDFSVDSFQETDSDSEFNSIETIDESFLPNETFSDSPLDDVPLATGLRKKRATRKRGTTAATKKPLDIEKETNAPSLSKVKTSKVTKPKNTKKAATEKHPQVHKAFTAADFTNSYQRMKQTVAKRGPGKSYETTQSDTVESFRQKLSINGETTVADDQLNEEVEADRYTVPGRENEFRNLYSRIASFVNTGTGSSIYLSGVPGTGKTYTVKKTIESLFNKNPNMFVFAEINGFKLINLDDCYESLCDKLNIEIPHGSTALTTLQHFFTDEKAKKVVLLLDEVDVLLKHDAEKLYNFFNWPYLVNSKLFVVAVGNNLNLSEQLDAKTNSRLGATNIISFRPYTQQNLADILRNTLNEFTKNNKIYIEKSSGSIALFSSSASAKLAENHKFFYQLLKINFSEDAINFLSRYSAGSTSDVRTAKGIGFAAIEMVEEEYGRQHGVIYNYEKTIDVSDIPDDNEYACSEFEIVEREVTVAIAAAAKAKSISSSAVEYVKNLTFLNQFILYVALNTFKSINNTTIPFTILVEKVETLMDKYSLTKTMKASFEMMNMMNKISGAHNVRLFDWDASINTLESVGMITFSKTMNERANFLVLKNVESIEEGLKSFEKSLL